MIKTAEITKKTGGILFQPFFFLLIISLCFSCKKCIQCSDRLIITSTSGRPEYPQYYQDEVEFCGQERRHGGTGSGYEINKYTLGPGDTIIYYQSRSCEAEK